MQRGYRIRRKVRRFLKRRQNNLIYFAALTGWAIFRVLPFSFGLWLGSLLGLLTYYILPKERKRVFEHLSIAFSQEKGLAERKIIARKSFQNLGKNAVELVNFHKLKKSLDDYVTIEGLHYLDDALAKGRGVIWITAHLGNWELLALYIASCGYPLTVVAREVYDKRLNRILLNFRKESAVSVILRDSPSAGREILKVLKNKGILAMLIDQDTKVKGVMVDFFGKKANTPAGPALLAGRRSVPVLPGFIHRVSDKKHKIVICPMMDIVQTENVQQDLETNTERFNKLLEHQIREHPEEWVWMHRRWRRKTAYRPPVR